MREVENRRVPRLSVRHLSFVHCDGHVVSVEVANISEIGVGLRSDSPLPSTGRLHLAWPGNSLQREIEILRCEPGGDGFLAGARFTPVAGADDPLYRYIDYVRPRAARQA